MSSFYIFDMSSFYIFDMSSFYIFDIFSTCRHFTFSTCRHYTFTTCRHFTFSTCRHFKFSTCRRFFNPSIKKICEAFDNCRLLWKIPTKKAKIVSKQEARSTLKLSNLKSLTCFYNFYTNTKLLKIIIRIIINAQVYATLVILDLYKNVKFRWAENLWSEMIFLRVWQQPVVKDSCG